MTQVNTRNGIAGQLRDVLAQLRLHVGKRWCSVVEDAATAIEQRDARIAELEVKLSALIHERNVLQKICARRSDALEAAGLHAESTIDEVKTAIAELVATATRDALERAAKIFEEGSHELWMPEEAAAAIRALPSEGSGRS